MTYSCGVTTCDVIPELKYIAQMQDSRGDSDVLWMIAHVSKRIFHLYPILLGTSFHHKVMDGIITPSFKRWAEMVGGGATRPLPRDGGAKDPTVGTHPKVWTRGQKGKK